MLSSRTAQSPYMMLRPLGDRPTDAIKALQAEHRDDCTVMSIGPAGENLVRFANIMNENERAAGRGGTGVVAGSKNLKAIVIKGDKKNQPKPADRAAFKGSRQEGPGSDHERGCRDGAAEGRPERRWHQRTDERNKCLPSLHCRPRTPRAARSSMPSLFVSGSGRTF